MENQNKKFPFPQADDFSKIILLINLDDEKKLSDKELLGKYLGDIVERQVMYYISACQYLGLINENKEYTELGNKIRQYDSMRQNIELAKLIVKDDIFGTVFFYQQMLGVSLEKSEIINIMREYIDLSKDGIYKRRSQTVVKWVEWITENLNK
ncbi:MAG: hypothetical protein Q4C49_05410 [Bacillota bacterium]|nr:hypothetical protein [Bacillota bacterium]